MSFPFSFWKFDPISVANMRHWIAADYGVTQVAGSTSAVLDRSTNSTNLTGSGGASNPGWNASGQANRPFFSFDSASNQQFTFTGFSTTQTYFALSVIQARAVGAQIDAWSNNGANVQVLGSTSNNNILCYGNASQVCMTTANFDTTTKPVLLAASVTAGTVAIWVNGASQAMNPALTLAAATINSLGVVVGVSCNMNIYEQIFYLTVPSATQISQLFEYFRSKYSLY